MNFGNQKTPIQKEWDSLIKKENSYLSKRQVKKDSALNKLLAEKVPEKLQQTLDAAFYKAFLTIFENGTKVIEKTYKKEELETQYKLRAYEHELRQSRQSLKLFSKEAGAKGAQNLFLSGAAGIGMGIAGVGLPDIPLFMGMVFRSIYEIALSYGYTYESEREQYFILLLIEGAVAYGEDVKRINDRANAFIAENMAPIGYQKAQHAKSASAFLSRELLYMKFLQGIPVVGAVGGAYDAVYMKRITEYAALKYKRRFLEDKMRGKK